MWTRREILQCGSVLALSPLATACAATIDIDPREKYRSPTVLLVDSRHPDANRIGKLSASRGIVTREFESELAELYYDYLDPRRNRGSLAVIAGVSSIAPTFYLERLAWDAGLRIAFLSRHSSAPGGDGPAHRLSGPAAMIDCFHARLSMSSWHEAVANTLQCIPVECRSLNSIGVLRDAAVQDDPSLFTWVMSPAGSQFLKT